MNSLNSLDLSDQVAEIIESTSSLREVTYSYLDLWDGKYFNETLFIDYLGLPQSLKNVKTFFLYMQEKNHSDQAFFQEIKKATEEKLHHDITLLEEYLKQCDDSEKNQISMLIAALRFTYESVDFELEAVGYETELTEQETYEKTQRLYDLDTTMFWEHISENPDFLSETYAYLVYHLDTFGSQLEESERLEIEKWAQSILEKLISLTANVDIWDSIPAFIPEEESSEFKSLKDVVISRDDYKEIFNAFFEVSWVPQRSKEWNYGSFYDGDEYYWIPKNSSYETKTLEELLKLAPHEAGHYINLKVTQDRWDNKHPGDMVKEEWLAKLTEKLIAWVSIDKVNAITFSAPSVALARLMNGSDFSSFQSAYGSLLVHAWIHSSKRDSTKEVLRKKRGFSKNFPWGSNKDAAYSLWLFSVLQYINAGTWSIENLFGWKISMSDVESWKFLPEGFWNGYISHILLAELIFFYIKQRENIKKNEGNFHGEFVSYLKEKYKDLSESFELFSEVERFTFNNKRKVVQILRIIDKSLEE